MSAEASRPREYQDATYMRRALELAEIAVSRGQTPFGAVVVDPAGQLVGEGHNTVRADLDPTAHGEIVATATRGGGSGPGSGSAAPRCTRAASRASFAPS